MTAPVVTPQLPLIPERLLTLSEMSLVPVERFPPDADLLGPPPTAALVESIRRWGVLEPVLVRAVGGGLDYASPKTLVSGRRRIKAVRLLQTEYRAKVNKIAADHPDTILNDETVPGYRAVYERMRDFMRVPVRHISDPEGVVGDGRTEALAVMTNAVRTDNPATDLHNLAYLLARFVAQGLTERGALAEVASATGLAPGTVKQRLRLLDLSLDLQDDFLAGRLGYTVALHASRLGPEGQAVFASMVDGGQRPTLEMVKQAKKDAVKQHQLDLLDDLPGPAGEVSPAWPGADLVGRASALATTLGGIKMPIMQEAAATIEALLDAIREKNDG